MTRLRLPIAPGVGIIAACMLAACTTTGSKPNAKLPAAPGTLSIGVGASSITAPDSVRAGITAVTVTSTGSGRAHVVLDRLAEGVTFDQIEKAPSQDQDRLATVVGGNGSVGSGLSTTVILDLPTGNYEIVQFTQSDGPPPTHRLVVTPSSGRGSADPVAKGEVVAKGRTLTLAPGFDGKGTWRVTNQDAKDDHEATVLKLAPGKAVTDVIAYFRAKDRTGPPPAEAMGGMGDLPPGRSGWMVLDLPPGNYAVACFVPDDSGMPHVAMGMITPFVVS